MSHVRSGGLDAASADDIAAEVMTVAWRRLDTVPGAPVEARRWLCGVARNVARNYRRSSFRERRRVARLGEELASGSGRGRVIGEYATSASVDCGLGEPGAVEALDLWQGLDPRDQRVLGLALAGRALDEVAEELACARSAAAMRLSRARRRLALAMSS